MRLVGESCALLAAMVWALALVLFRASGQSVPPLSLNLFKNAIGLLLLASTILVLREGFWLPGGATWSDVGTLALSGIIGISIADTLFFYGLNRIGVGIISVVDCSYTPFVIFFSTMLLGERLEPYHYAGVLLILVGVLMASGHAPPANITRPQLLVGVLAASASMCAMAYAIVIAKPVLERTPLLWATFVRMIAGSAVLALFGALHPDRRRIVAVFRPSQVWKVAIPGAALGTYVSLLLWVAGFKYASASVAAVLNQTSVIFALLLATLMLREPLTRRKIAAVTLAFAGVALVTLFPYLSG